jgi:hypothetical protein
LRIIFHGLGDFRGLRFAPQGIFAMSHQGGAAIIKTKIIMNNNDENEQNETEPIEAAPEETIQADKGEDIPEVQKDAFTDLLVSNPALCRLIADLIDGKTIDQAIVDNFKGWVKQNSTAKISDESVEKLSSLANVSDEMRQKIISAADEIRKNGLNDTTANLLLHALDYDNAVKNADASGYIRGKNEKIELVKDTSLPLRKTKNGKSKDEPLFPQYSHVSVWEK